LTITILNEFRAAETDRAWRTDSARALAQLRKGKIVRLRAYQFPHESFDHEIPLVGFNEAYEELLTRVKSGA
jgi:hypothetical protein